MQTNMILHRQRVTSYRHSNSSSSSSSISRCERKMQRSDSDYGLHETMTEMADGDFHDYINFEYYLQNIGKYPTVMGIRHLKWRRVLSHSDTALTYRDVSLNYELVNCISGYDGRLRFFWIFEYLPTD